MSGRFASQRLTVILFFATIAILLVMREYFPSELAIPLPGSEIRPVLLLEFADQPAHLVHIFGEQGDPLREARVRGMNTGNAIDYLLMVAYGLLIFTFFSCMARELQHWGWLILGVLGLVASMADAVENAIMFSMVRDFLSGADVLGEMAFLPWFVWTKFGLLAVTCAGAAIAFAKLGRWVLMVLCIPAPILMIPGWLNPFGLAPLATTTIALGWLAMVIHAATRWYATRRQGTSGLS